MLARYTLAACLTLLPASTAPTSAGEPRIDNDAFWTHWGDGRAEVSGYRLTVPRYGALRTGTAVAIVVTEDFMADARVKAEDPTSGRHIPVIKLNLVQDFQTGVYDYNLMTSVFVALGAEQGRPAGSTSKIAFGCQEWCGHVYHHLLFDRRAVRSELHSYFQREGDRTARLPHPDDALPADAILLWARGLAYPRLAPGEQRTVQLLDRLQDARLDHTDPAWHTATLARAADSAPVTVPAGTFDVWTCTVTSPDTADWTIHVESAAPHRIVRWSRSNGERAELLGSERMAYWQMNGPGMEQALQRIGLGAGGARQE